MATITANYVISVEYEVPDGADRESLVGDIEHVAERLQGDGFCEAFLGGDVASAPVSAVSDVYVSGSDDSASHVVPARIYADGLGSVDINLEARFDAVPWLESASDDDLRRFIDDDFRGGSCGDLMAESCSQSSGAVRSFYARLNTLVEVIQDVGSTAEVLDVTAANAWIAEHRPSLIEDPSPA